MSVFFVTNHETWDKVHCYQMNCYSYNVSFQYDTRYDGLTGEHIIYTTYIYFST